MQSQRRWALCVFFQAPTKRNRTSNANAAYHLGAKLNGPTWAASVRVSMRGEGVITTIAENSTFVGFNCDRLFYRIGGCTVCVDWVNDSPRAGNLPDRLSFCCRQLPRGWTSISRCNALDRTFGSLCGDRLRLCSGLAKTTGYTRCRLRSRAGRNPRILRNLHSP